MKKPPFKAVLVLLSVGFTAGCMPVSSKQAVDPPAQNVILFIGDGMGAEHRKAARWVTVGQAGRLSMDEMPARGWIHTHSANSPMTDSAAAATAMASGVKTNNGVVGLNAMLGFVSSILEQAKRRGKSVGLVTTTHLTHATPAAFATHIEDRDLMTEIADQMLTAGVDVLLGGGEDEFIPASVTGCFPQAGERGDGRNLVQEAIAGGYTFVCDPFAFAELDPDSVTRLLGLFGDEGMTRPFAPTLAQMTRKAIDILAPNPRGFFLMVEAGQIDWASHDNDAADAISDTVGLDEAIEVAKRFAARAKATLIIVTADHETGGMTLSRSPTGSPGEDGPFRTPDGGQFYVNWSTTGHTTVDVPVTASGPSSELLNGRHDNTFIYDVMERAFETGGGFRKPQTRSAVR
jgi:alkaline phosphatase